MSTTGEDDDPPVAGATASPTVPPVVSDDEMVGSILSNARKEGESESSSSWSGAGRTLGSSASTSTESGAPAVPEPPSRHNAKRVRVIFWADGFTVEDVSAEEEEAKARELAEKNAPRRTGVVGLGSASDRAAERRAQMPKIPELRPYEQNKEFMEDLKQGIPPLELREMDLSSGQPRPRPVDIMLGDMRPQAYPAEAVRRMGRMMGPPPEMQPPVKKLQAFSGAGRTLADEASSSSDGATAAAATAVTASGEWPSAAHPMPEVDAASPTTEVQVRLAGGGAPQRFKLNKTHTVADLKKLVEGALSAAGHAPRGYILSSGFPPKPLTDETVTLEAAALLNAAITHRWA